MTSNCKEIKITYQYQTFTQNLCLKDQVYIKIAQLLKTNSDELVIIIDNDYNQIVPRSNSFSQFQNDDYYVYNIKDLLKEKGLASNQIASRNKDNNVHIQINPTFSQEIIQEGDYEQSILESITKEIQQKCQLCQKYINGNSIQTKCYHHYHSECFKSFINLQINSNKTIIACDCNQQIKVQLIVNQISNIGDQINVLFDNQIKRIYENNQKIITKCQKNQQCTFLYIEKDNQSVSYCQVCDNKESNQLTTQ